MANRPTRHKEYSLIAAAAAAVCCASLSPAMGLPGLAAVNALAVFAILYSAFSVVRHADVLAHRYGEPYGSLILSLSIVVLEASLISILMLSGKAQPELMRDTIYSVIVIVMAGFVGAALLLGGRKYKSQSFNFIGVKHFLISIIPLSLVVLAMPTALGTGTFSNPQLAVVSLCCLMVYATFLRIQTVTHRSFFVYADEDSDGHHGKPSSRGNAWHFGFLLVHLVAVIVVTKLNTPFLERMLDLLDAPPSLPGFIVALLILSPEGTGAFRSILENQVQRAMNLLLGSVLATISLTVPLVATVAVLTGQELALGLPVPHILLLITTLMVCQASLSSGKTNAHSGSAHLILFLIYAMLMFS